MAQGGSALGGGPVDKWAGVLGFWPSSVYIGSGPAGPVFGERPWPSGRSVGGRKRTEEEHEAEEEDMDRYNSQDAHTRVWERRLGKKRNRMINVLHVHTDGLHASSHQHRLCYGKAMSWSFDKAAGPFLEQVHECPRGLGGRHWVHSQRHPS